MLPHLYVHTWFLGVEVHLYLLWGLLCAGIALLAKRLFPEDANKSIFLFRMLLLAASVTGAVFSYLRMQTMYNAIAIDPDAAIDPSPVYFDTLARASTFLLGAASATVFRLRPKEKTSSSLFRIFFLVSVMAVLTGGYIVLGRILSFSGKETYRFGFAASSILTVIIIRLTGILHSLTPNTREPRFLSTTAGLSYNLYLFHWPLYIVYSNNFRSNPMAVTVTLALSIAFSVLVFYGLEPLFHRKIPLPNWRHPVLRRLLYTTASLFILVFVVMDGLVYARAPEISALEEQILTGQLYQDMDKIVTLQRRTESINSEPLFPKGAIPVNSYLHAGVIIVGDSNTVIARKLLIETIPDCIVDAATSRQMAEGYDFLMQMQNNNSLREYIVVTLGTNANSNAPGKIEDIIRDIRPGHRLIFLTPYNGVMTPSWITYKIMLYVRTLPEKYPFVTVADWAAHIEKQPWTLGSDKVHVAGSSVKLYVDVIAEAIITAGKKPAK
jgi:hypothetical protein